MATTRREKEEKEKRLTELETQLATVKTVDPKTEEEVQSKLKELNMYRRRYDLDQDPEIKQKYDVRIEQADTAIPDILKRNQAGEGLLNLIKDEGGWSKFSKSNRVITLADGSKVSSAELADQIVQALPFSERKTVDSLTMEQITLKREKERFLEAELKQADDYFKKRDEDSRRGTEDHQKRIKEAEATLKAWQQKVAVDNAFLKEQPIPKDATPEQKKAIEEDNSHAKELNSTLKKNLEAKDLDGMLGIVLDAVKFYNEKRERTKLAAKVAGGSSAASSKPSKPQSLEEAFDALQHAKASSNDD